VKLLFGGARSLFINLRNRPERVRRDASSAHVHVRRRSNNSMDDLTSSSCGAQHAMLEKLMAVLETAHLNSTRQA
jgi:hypothetical protein